jgi:hypothetical protein
METRRYHRGVRHFHARLTSRRVTTRCPIGGQLVLAVTWPSLRWPRSPGLRLHSDLRSGVVAASTAPLLQVRSSCRPGWAGAEPGPGGATGDSFSGFTETGGGGRGCGVLPAAAEGCSKLSTKGPVRASRRAKPGPHPRVPVCLLPPKGVAKVFCYDSSLRHPNSSCQRRG